MKDNRPKLLEAIGGRVDELNAKGGGPKWTRADWLRAVAERNLNG